MKKTMYLSLALLLLTASGAWAYEFNNTTQVQEWNGSGLYNGGAWTGWIGDSAVFQTMGATLNGSTLSIFTNWNPGKDGDLGYSQIQTADLFIYDLSKSAIFAIQLDTNKPGTGYVYLESPTTITTSVDIFKTLTGLYYGGRYNDQGSALPVPVQGTGGIYQFTTIVGWSSTSPSAVNNVVSVDLSGLNLGNDQWSFVWGTATCGNDTFSQQVVGVPEPGSLLLLGVGFAGLGVYRKRAWLENRV